MAEPNEDPAMKPLTFFARLACSLLVLWVGACSPAEQQTRQSGWTDSLRTVLLERVAEDQAVRDRFVAAMQGGKAPDLALIHELGAMDSSNTAWLREMVTRHGWPDRDVVGQDGAKAAFLLVQHADADTAFQVEMLDSLQASFERGQADGQSVALLTDRVAIARGLPQQYGTQTKDVNGRFVLEPVVDSANLDARRKTMGLPPIAEYIRILDSVYFGRRTR